MSIRSISDLDIPALLAVEESSQPVPWSEDAFKRCWEANYPAWVMEDDDKIVAFVIISLASGECHVLNLCVHPDYQRRGHGKALLIHALHVAKLQGAGIVYLEVRRSNTNAIELYRKMNFKHIADRRNYYPHTPKGPEDALVFARDLGIE
jgi:ribosomal-protein-alanine N-acetyltransferase